MNKTLGKLLSSLMLVAILLLTSCSSQPPSRFEQAQTESTQRGASAVVKESTAGGNFNKFFPAAGDGYERVFSQEKQGFAEAKLKKDGKDVAVMSIADTLNNPDALNKFKDSEDKIGGYPAVKQGNTGTAVLVGDRYQVKVLSRDPSFTETKRRTWLEKFDFQGLAALK